MNSIILHERDHLANFKLLLVLIANTWATLHSFEYRLFENRRGHFAWRVNQALISAINTFPNNSVFWYVSKSTFCFPNQFQFWFWLFIFQSYRRQSEEYFFSATLYMQSIHLSNSIKLFSAPDTEHRHSDLFVLILKAFYKWLRYR